MKKSDFYAQRSIKGSFQDTLVLHDWTLPPTLTPKAVVVLVHGLGEHAERYHHVATALNDAGYVVRSYDQVGHGLSGGKRGCLAEHLHMIHDLALVIDLARNDFGSACPFFLIGHSMGGLVAADFVARKIRPVDGLVLSSPALAVDLNPAEKILLAVLPKVLPNLCIGNGVTPQYLSHDPAVEVAYRRDKLVHDRISGRLVSFIVQEAKYVQEAAVAWTVPTLLLFAGDDKQVVSRGSREFAKRSPSTVVQTKEYPMLYHEILNERDGKQILEEAIAWLGDRISKRSFS